MDGHNPAPPFSFVNQVIVNKRGDVDEFDSGCGMNNFIQRVVAQLGGE
jgi:hypothetical protein